MSAFRKKVIYGKIGRTIELEPSRWGPYGGDNEAPALLLDLARAHPDVEWVVVSKNHGWTSPLPNITNPWIDPDLRQRVSNTMRDNQKEPWKVIPVVDEIMYMFDDSVDGVLLWLGQHGVGNSRIPSISPPYEPLRVLMNFALYASFMLRGVNYWKREERFREREEVWLLPDVRNYLKARDLKWPTRKPVLSQYETTRRSKYYRYRDPRSPETCGYSDVKVDAERGVWIADVSYVYSGLELCGVSQPWALADLPGFSDRETLGVIINENKINGGANDRKNFLRDWILPNTPSWVHGGWSDASKAELGVDIRPIEYDIAREKMTRIKTTVTTPASGSIIATAKPWESFAAGVVCFFAGSYDAQGHIIPTLQQMADATVDRERFTDDDITLAKWLRVTSADVLTKRIAAVESSRETWEWLVAQQYSLLSRRKKETQVMNMIASRLGI